MAERIFLHIGAPKTGTSYLQEMIWNNREELFDQNLFMPPGGRRKQFDAVADLRGGMWRAGKLRASWDLLVERVHRRDGTALVSEELLCATPHEQVLEAVESLKPADVHVIVGARDIGRQVPAEWQQALRSRSAMTYWDWLTRLRDEPDRSFWDVQDPVKVYQRWGVAVKPGNFHVMTVPAPGESKGLLWERFCSIIGIDPTHAEPPESSINQSLGLHEAELLRRFNARLGARFPLRRPYVEVVRDNLMVPGLFGAPGAVQIGVPAAHAEWIQQRASQIIDGLVALGDRVDIVGSVEELQATTTQLSQFPAEIDESELLDAALNAWVRQMEWTQAEQERWQTLAAKGDVAADGGSMPRTAKIRRALGGGRRAAGSRPGDPR